MRFPVERFNSFASELVIQSKEKGSIKLANQNGCQRFFIRGVAQALDEGVHYIVCLKARQLGLCLDPDTRVLTADLRWVRIADISIGQEIVSVDESGPGGLGTSRKMRTGVIQGSIQVFLHAYRITFDDGRSLICTGQHPWLSKKTNVKWRSIEMPDKRERLKIGDYVRWITKPWHEPTIEDGWFGGMLDGEGSISNEKRPGSCLNVSQLLGPVWDRLREYAESRGYHAAVQDDKTFRKTKYGKSPVPKLVFSRMDEIFRLIGQTRPTKFLGKRFWEDRELPGKHSGIGWSKIISIESIGWRTMVDLQTSLGTYIAEGFVSHNTTICSALDLFWHYEHPGTQGTFAAHNEEARDNFRQMLNTYHFGLPRSHRVKMIQNNRYFIAWANRSKLAMQIGGSDKKAGGKGRGLGLSYCHATECSSWSDEESLASILASLAETNPLRLYLFESTARGYNLFHEMWKDAQNAVTQRAIFIGWWLNEFYRKEKDSSEYKTYWTGEYTPAERDWMRGVKLLYDYDIVPEQIAWWRWLLAEKIHDENLLMQDFPPTERHAFILTGKNYFSLSTVDDIERQIDEEEGAHYYRFRLGDDFLDTRVEETIETMANFTIWEMPDPSAHYSIGADPAFGSSDWADQFALEVYRCYSDRFEQVAEFCTSQLKAPYQFAWVICAVAGLYRNSRVNLEINGPGEAVQNEINNLRRKASQIPSRAEQMNDAQYKTLCDNRLIMRDVLGMMRYYLYRRLDSPYGGVGAYHTITTHKMKERMLGAFNDLVEKKECVIHSAELVEEMKIVVRDEGSLGAPDRGKDDRVIASALAAVQYIEGMKVPLEQMGFSYARELQKRGRFEETGKLETPNETALARSVKSYLERVGIK